MPLSSVLGAQSLVRPGVCTSTTRPASPFEGQVIYETDTKQTLVYNGSAWVMLADASAPPGLQLVKTQTIGTAVSSVTVSSVFSATYDHYKIMVSGGTASTNVNIRLALGATTTGYSYWIWERQTGAFLSADLVNGAFIQFGYGTTGFKNGSIEILNPFASDETIFLNGAGVRTDAYVNVGGYLNNTTSYTDFTLTCSTGTITGGTIRVYGYRNS